MFTVKIISFALFVLLNFQKSKMIEIDYDKLPHGFLIGTGTSAFQIEGTWNISEKTSSFLDDFSLNHRNSILDHFTAEIVADSYHKYKEDVKIIKDIGFDTYRFSLSWSKILPNGYADLINEEAINYYNNLINELLKNGIIPIVTIYHWDHPKSLENIGGWLNERMAYIYADYARIVFEYFGDGVKYFTTINEPLTFCMNRYKAKILGSKNDTFGYFNEYHCIHNMLKAHALAYHMYNSTYRKKQEGQIGIAVACDNYYNKNDYDFVSSNRAFDFNCGIELNPIFSKTGDYPIFVKNRIALISKFQGYKYSRLPSFSREWIEFIRGTSDYIGINHYTSHYVEQLPYYQMLRWPNDEGLKYTFDPNWPSTASFNIKVVPEGFGDMLRKLKVKYNNPPIFILENGLPDNNGIDDYWKIYHLHSYLKEMLIAIKRDGCNVRSYSVRSFLDEFNLDYVPKFGIVHVDYNSKNKTRTLKKSALWFKEMLKYQRLIPPDTKKFKIK